MTTARQVTFINIIFMKWRAFCRSSGDVDAKNRPIRIPSGLNWIGEIEPRSSQDFPPFYFLGLP